MKHISAAMLLGMAMISSSIHCKTQAQSETSEQTQIWRTINDYCKNAKQTPEVKEACAKLTGILECEKQKKSVTGNPDPLLESYCQRVGHANNNEQNKKSLADHAMVIMLNQQDPWTSETTQHTMKLIALLYELLETYQPKKFTGFNCLVKN